MSGWMSMETKSLTYMFIEAHINFKWCTNDIPVAVLLFPYSPVPSSSCTPSPWEGSAATGSCCSWTSSEWSPGVGLARRRWRAWRRRRRCHLEVYAWSQGQQARFKRSMSFGARGSVTRVSLDVFQKLLRWRFPYGKLMMLRFAYNWHRPCGWQYHN